jgi:hypothetical protein
VDILKKSLQTLWWMPLPPVALLFQPTSDSAKKRNWLDGFVSVGKGFKTCCLGGKNGRELGSGKWAISRWNMEWSKGKLLLGFYFSEIQNKTPHFNCHYSGHHPSSSCILNTTFRRLDSAPVFMSNLLSWAQ